VVFEKAETGSVMADTVAQPLDQDSQVKMVAAPETVSSQPEPVMCQTDGIVGSGNGRYFIRQYNCEANLYIQLQDTATSNTPPVVYARGYFLNWSPDSAGFLFRDIDADQVQYIPVDNTAPVTFALPFGTYDAAFAPNGQTLVYAASRGLGFGSEVGIIDLSSGTTLAQHHYPRQIVAYPRWSPDSLQLVTILMPDSNIPFTTGELWLNDALAYPVALLDTLADAGHGYPPAWSPNGQTITFIRRENPASIVANQNANALHSNIYQINTRAISVAAPQTNAIDGWGQATPIPTTPSPVVAAVPLTHFDASLVYDMVWSPDGSQLAFTANDAVWTLTPGEEAIQVSPANTTARHPVWAATP
jgi:Tol biopolymer transport system component